MATQPTITIYDNNDKVINLNLNDANGDAIDITGYKFIFTIKKKDSDTDAQALLKKEVTSHSNPTGGITSIFLTDADTNLSAGDYPYDIQMIADTGAITTLIRDTIRIYPRVTDATS